MYTRNIGCEWWLVELSVFVSMDAQKVTNLLLLCLGLFTAGVSLTLLVPFYPSEALAKVRSYDKHCNTINGVSDKFPTPCAFSHCCNLKFTFLLLICPGRVGDPDRCGAEHGVHRHHRVHAAVREGDQWPAPPTSSVPPLILLSAKHTCRSWSCVSVS